MKPISVAAATAELAVMRKLCTALDSLDRAAQQRVLDWLVDRYQHTDVESANHPEGTA